MQTNVLIKEECILKNKNKSCPYKKLSVFYNSCLKTFGSHLLVAGPQTFSCYYSVYRVIGNNKPLNNRLGIYIFCMVYEKHIISTEKIKV